MYTIILPQTLTKIIQKIQFSVICWYAIDLYRTLLNYYIIYLFVFKQVHATDIQLLGSPEGIPNAGRVQLYYKDAWRDVCHDGDDWYDKDWSVLEAMVACRQLGYPGTAMGRKGGYGNGADSAGLDSFTCNGSKSIVYFPLDYL